MRKILHLIPDPDDCLASEIIEEQRHLKDDTASGVSEIVVFELYRSDVNYYELVDQIFEADSIQVW